MQGRLGPSYDAPDFGISEKLTTRVVAQFFGKRPEEIERLYRKLGDHGLVAEKLFGGERGLSLVSLNRKIAAHVQQVYDELMALARASGAGSVDKKVRSLVALLERASPLEAKFILRIPVGRLRLGVGDATVLDGLSKSTTVPRTLIERAYNLCSDLGLVARILYEGGEAALKRFRVQVGRPIKMQFAERVKNFDGSSVVLARAPPSPSTTGSVARCIRDGTRVRVFSRNQEDTTEMLPDIHPGNDGADRAQARHLRGRSAGL